jgi:glycosyltransferase involved in cell wall biosynthesis
MDRLDLVWHEAANPLYEDRFSALSEYFDLNVYGFTKFQGKVFDVTTSKDDYNLILKSPIFSFHWLTVFSFSLMFSLMKSNSKYVYIHEEAHSLLAFLICLLCRNKILILDSAVINNRLSFFGFNFMEKYVYKRVSGFFYRNEDVRNVLIERGVNKEKLLGILGNGVSLKTFTKANKQTRASDGPVIVGFAGRVWKWKGVECLVDIQNMDGFQVNYCGPIVDEYIHEALLASGAKYFGMLDKNGLQEFYSSIDLFILPSLPAPNWKEQFGRVIVESVFSGAPAIGSNTGFIPTLVGPDATFLAGDLNNIKRVVMKFKDPDSRDRLLDLQYDAISKKYSWEAIAKCVYLESKGFV